MSMDKMKLQQSETTNGITICSICGNWSYALTMHLFQIDPLGLPGPKGYVCQGCIEKQEHSPVGSIIPTTWIGITY